MIAIEWKTRRRTVQGYFGTYPLQNRIILSPPAANLSVRLCGGLMFSDYHPAKQLVDELNFQLQQLEDGADVSDALKLDTSRNLNTLQRTVGKLQLELTSESRGIWKPCVPRF